MLIQPTSYLAQRFASVLQEPAGGTVAASPAPEPQDGYQATPDMPQAATVSAPPPAPTPPAEVPAPAYQSPVPTTILDDSPFSPTAPDSDAPVVPQLSLDPSTGILRYQSIFPDTPAAADPDTSPEPVVPQLTLDPTTGILRYQSIFADVPATPATSPAPTPAADPSTPAPQSQGLLADLGYSE